MRGLILLAEIIGALAVLYVVARSVLKRMSPDEIRRRNRLARRRREREREEEIRELEGDVEREERRLQRLLAGPRKRQRRKDDRGRGA